MFVFFYYRQRNIFTWRGARLRARPFFFPPAAFENAAVQIKAVVVIIAYESSGE